MERFHRLMNMSHQKKWIVVFILLLATTASARTKTSLNTGWRFIRSDVANAQQIDLNDSEWQRVNVPHTWNVEDPWDDEPGYYRGPGWYRREFNLDRSFARKRIILMFEGVNQVADVYFNGTKVGSHTGGYSAFSFDVSDFVNLSGRNVLAVRVDNSFNEDIPPLTADFNFYGGIYRDVWLIAADHVHFPVTDHASPGVQITTPDISIGRGTVQIKGSILSYEAAPQNVEVVTSVIDARQRRVAQSVEQVLLRRLDATPFLAKAEVARPNLWSPDSPYLYTVRMTIRRGGRVLDEIVQPLGFRWFEFSGEHGFHLNGRPMKLRGANRHQDYKGLGNAVPDRMHVRDMQILKDAGFNFVRLAHYPQDPSVLEACDRLGLLVWEETPLVNYITPSAAFTANSVQMAREMVRQHRNHPSMLLWGYMNEIFLRSPNNAELHKATVDLARELNRTVKEEDPTRPTTIAFHGNDIYNRTGLGDVPDVIGWNLYQGWYSATVDDFGKFIDDQHARFPERPLIISEYGANGDRRLSSAEPRRFDSTTDYQRFFHESYLDQIDARPWLNGTAIWNEFDFGSEFRGETIPHLNQKGMYTFDRKPKDVHFFYKARLSNQPVLHIAVDDHPKRAGVDGKQRIDVYSNLANVELLQNGKSLGARSIDERRKASWDVVLRPGLNHFSARGTRSRTVVIDSATVSFTKVDADSPEIAINVGSNANFVDERGRIWIADQPYVRGLWGYVGSSARRIFSQPPDRNILGTYSDPLFQTMVEGIDSYRVDVPDGDYEVELVFAETKFEKAGKRVFDVLINGATVVEKLDLAKEVGRSKAYTRTKKIATPGGLNVSFRRIAGDPVLSGIRVRRLLVGK